ncbi:hypothetical protein PcaKH15_15580 [Parageobacillus caldoxylosilyticus]|nr:hypothetical protein PcaKH15_15580 [Parageobacillus caldoxylosilyticus]BDG39431.1 hypothetical protein PcaKH16_15700 [Parageobacillus caldoxylosilyticus]BDG43214.1 hypothetical protein PcaKH35_15590 [Parageobacillus caldoxylosilyticus]
MKSLALQYDLLLNIVLNTKYKKKLLLNKSTSKKAAPFIIRTAFYRQWEAQ